MHLACDRLPAMITVAIIDDDPLVRDKLTDMVKTRPNDFTVSTVTNSVAGLLEVDTPAQVVLLDVILREDTTLVKNVTVLTEAGYKVLVISAQPDRREIVSAISRIRFNFLPKADLFDGLFQAIKDTADGKPVISSDVLMAAFEIVDPHLTSREEEIMRLNATGMSIRQIARRLNIRDDTVRDHRSKYLEKFRKVGQKLDNPVKLHYAALDAGILRDGREEVS